MSEDKTNESRLKSSVYAVPLKLSPQGTTL